MSTPTNDKPSTLLVFVQDETGSMNNVRDQTISAFNEYFGTLKQDRDQFGDVSAHVWQFSEVPGEERVRAFHHGTLASVPRLHSTIYRPRGITPLLDAVGTAMRQAEATTVDRYLFVVQTDGIENASRDFTREQVVVMVDEKEKADNWTLVFLGAGIANWAQAAAMGVGAAPGSTTSYAPRDTVTTYSAAAGATAAFLAENATADKNLGQKIEQKAQNPPTA